MSAFSTLHITRTRALAEFAKSIRDMDDERLESFMDKLLEPRLYNVIIVDDDGPNDDDVL
jgi:hypothetical protein